MQAAQQMYKLLEENNELIRQGKDELEAAVEENMRADEAVTISEKETLDSVSASSPAEQPQPVISPTEVCSKRCPFTADADFLRRWIKNSERSPRIRLAAKGDNIYGCEMMWLTWCAIIRIRWVSLQFNVNIFSMLGFCFDVIWSEYFSNGKGLKYLQMDMGL